MTQLPHPVSLECLVSIDKFSERSACTQVIPWTWSVFISALSVFGSWSFLLSSSLATPLACSQGTPPLPSDEAVVSLGKHCIQRFYLPPLSSQVVLMLGPFHGRAVFMFLSSFLSFLALFSYKFPLLPQPRTKSALVTYYYSSISVLSPTARRIIPSHWSVHFLPAHCLSLILRMYPHRAIDHVVLSRTNYPLYK